jgi:hypothetical protein
VNFGGTGGESCKGFGVGLGCDAVGDDRCQLLSSPNVEMYANGRALDLKLNVLIIQASEESEGERRGGRVCHGELPLWPLSNGNAELNSAIKRPHQTHSTSL